MGCKTITTRDLLSKNSSSSDSSSCGGVGGGVVRDALLLSTMCIIGLPVEVQVTDGSIYSGICHTACFHNDYGIILKKARMIKKGTNLENEEEEALIDTLVVCSCDIVQVVAKGILLPSSQGIVSDDDVTSEEDAGAIAPSLHFLQTEMPASSTNHIIRNSGQDENKPVNDLTNKNAWDGLPSTVQKGQRKGDFLAKSLRSAPEVGNGNNTTLEKIDVAITVQVGPVAEGQVGKNQSQGKEYEPYQKFGSRKDNAIHQVQSYDSGANASLPHLQSLSNVHVDVFKTSSIGSSCGSPVPSLVKPYNQDFEKPTLTGSSLHVRSPSIKGVNMRLQLSTSQSASHTPSVAPKDSVSNTSSKEFKLNPGAKTFMPMFSIPKSAASPTPTTTPSMDYIPNNPPVVPVAVAPPENGINHFAPPSSMPTKLVPYSNLVAVNGDTASHFSQHIGGHVGSRLQSVRYTSQYNPVQAGPAYVHPSSQAVMVGRLGQLVYMHPISHDVIQGSTFPAPVSLRPQLTPQVLFPKHQGNQASASSQELQVCVTQPPFVVSGQQAYAMASNAPFSQPAFPAVRSISIPGASGHFSTKFL